MKVFFRILLTVISLSIINAKADNLFQPLPDSEKCPWSLIKWNPLPFRIQYHGFIESSRLERYIFMVDGEMVYLQLNEIAKQQFLLKQVLSNGQQVLIEDLLTNELQNLISGEISYVPGKFDCILLDESTQQQVIFSDTKNIYKTENREVRIFLKDTNLHIWDIVKDKGPVLYVLSLDGQTSKNLQK